MPDDKDDDQEMVHTGTGLGHSPWNESVERGDGDGEFSNTRDDSPTHDPRPDDDRPSRRADE